jgi:hypothetical protein
VLLRRRTRNKRLVVTVFVLVVIGLVILYIASAFVSPGGNR